MASRDVKVTITADMSKYIEGCRKARAEVAAAAKWRTMAEEYAAAGVAIEILALDLELTNLAMSAVVKRKAPVVAQAGVEARFYIRGALSPKFADWRRADRYTRMLARRNRGAAVAFMRGMSERTNAGPRPPWFRTWGDDVIAVVTR